VLLLPPTLPPLLRRGRDRPPLEMARLLIGIEWAILGHVQRTAPVWRDSCGVRRARRDAVRERRDRRETEHIGGARSHVYPSCQFRLLAGTITAHSRIDLDREPKRLNSVQSVLDRRVIAMILVRRGRELGFERDIGSRAPEQSA